jgi:hypothetical protein
MIHRDQHARKMQVPLLGNVIASLQRKGFLGTLHDAIASQMPVGYEDEAGFHMGRETFSVNSGQSPDSEMSRF